MAALSEVEERILEQLTPMQRALFARFCLFLRDALEGTAPEQLVEASIAAGVIFREVALEFGNAAADLDAIGGAMYRRGAAVH